MNLNIGSILKKNRTERKITQEILAAALDVSPQAISRWESGYSYPDIELLPAIADFFAISIDELLGYRLSAREAALAALKREAEQLAETGTAEERIAHARRALVAFPFDCHLKLHLAYALYNQWEAFPERSDAIAVECEAICSSVLERSLDTDLRYSAVSCLCSLYSAQKEHDKALALINTYLAPMKYCRELLLAHGIGDGSTAIYIQDEIDKLTDSLGIAIQALALHDDLPNTPSTWDKKIEMLKTANALYTMIYGDAPLFYHIRLAKNHWLLSTYQIAQGKTAAALDSIEAMAHHTLAYDDAKENYHGKPYSSIFTDQLTYPYPSKDFHELTEHNDAYYMRERLAHKRYDALRSDPRFIAVIDRLDQAAK